MSDNIKVVVKVRPLISREIEEKLPHQWRVNNNTLYQIDSNRRDCGQTFTFDKVYDEDTKTCAVYNDIAKPIVEAAAAGINGTIFAYGQTSSGKTYTMTGTDNSPGIIQLAVLNLFDIIKKEPNRDFLVRVSYVELYNETLKDLLDMERQKEVKVHENFDGNIKVDALEKVTSTPEEVLEVMKYGNNNRQTGATNMNEKSSRSHSIFQITIESREHIEGAEQASCVNVSQLNLVDLAGSERAGQTGATGKRFKEGTHINKSLSALALVIKQLSEDPNKHANYRDNKLTRILQNSLGGNAKTSIICAITPAALEETVSTLQFATRAKTIKNKPEVNEVSNDATMIQKLTKELAQLQAKLKGKEQLEVILEKKEHVEQDLKNRIQNLQKWILNGFDQRSNVEMMGGFRKKLLQPRRVTIHSTSHVEETPAPTMPKFCTPSLKYNSMLISNTSEFVPIQGLSKLTTLPEEPTTPPKEKNVYFNNEVIELDSDDEVTWTNLTCSPYHIKCRDNTKTPPCVLREIANQAEIKCKDILEFTEREKIYQPEVVELMKQIEQSSAVTSKLYDEIEALKKSSEERINEVDLLKTEINKAKEEISGLSSLKIKLESQCQEYQTKLTDSEVSYETLQRKTKSREEELLSLLNQQHKQKVVEDISKIPIKPREYINFMDMSKDISLVNSEFETSIISQDGNVSPKSPGVRLDLQTQLNAKNQIIVDLETEMSALNCRVNSLEKSNNELLETVDNLKTNIWGLEKENSMLKSAVEAFNATLKDKQDSLTTAVNDMESYKTLIQELQIKLTQKEKLLNSRVSDAELDDMLKKDAHAIANNENFANIIHSFKCTLEKRNDQINELNNSLLSSNEDKNKLLLDLTEKSNEIGKLNDELFNLKEQLTSNTEQINKLLCEKDFSEKLYNEKLSQVESQKASLDKIIFNMSEQIDTITNERNELKISLTDKIENESKLLQINEQLDNKLKDINKLLCEKDVSEQLLNDKLLLAESLRASLDEMILKKNEELETITKDRDQLKVSLIDKKEKEANYLKVIEELENKLKDVTAKLSQLEESVSNKESTIENLTKNNEASNKFIEQTKQTITKVQTVYKILTGDIQDIPEMKDYYTLTNHLCEALTALQDICSYIVEEKETVNNTNALLEKECLHHKDEVYLLREEINKLQKTIQDHTYESKNLIATNNKLNQDLISYQSSSEDINTKSRLEIEIMANQVNLLEEQIKSKTIEISDLETKLVESEGCKDILIESIATKLSILMNRLHFENNFSFEEFSGGSHEQDVMLIFDKIVNHVLAHNFAIEDKSVTKALKEEQKQKELVAKHNLELTEKVSLIKNENQELLNKLKTIQEDNEILKIDLDKSVRLLRDLKLELKVKSEEITKIEQRATEWKKEFESLDTIMKNQRQYLIDENDKLKDRLLVLNKNTEAQIKRLNGETNESDEENMSIKFSGLTKNVVEIKSPPSLLTICCNTITDALELRDDSNSQSTNSNTKINASESTTNCGECEKLNLELFITKQENCKLLDIIEHLQMTNRTLLEEQDEVRKELLLFEEPAQELQKSILNHKTNLSILTATTFAENASLKSQVVGMKHHHKRTQNLWQRDLPDFKKSLSDLMSILKDDSTVSEPYTATAQKPPKHLNANSTGQTFNESTFDGDMLMLDTNVTLTTVDNTLVGLDFTETTLNDTTCQINNDIDTSILNINKSVIDKSRQIRELSTINNLEILTRELASLQDQKRQLEIKYNEAVSDIKVKESKMDRDYNDKEMQVVKLDNLLRNKITEINQLREENETLSNEIMEKVSEIDDLSNKLDQVKVLNDELRAKCIVLESDDTQISYCSKCCNIDLTSKQHENPESHAKLSRSMSDSESTSTINKICTLQTELHAGQEDCKSLTEHVAILKEHLSYSSISMDLDESMKEINVTRQQKLPDNNKSKITSNNEDLYKIDKIDCYNYYLEITGAENKAVIDELKMIEVMKLFYNNIVAKHSNNVENLVNKLRDYEEAQNILEAQINNLKMESTKTNSEVEQKAKTLELVTHMFTQAKSCIDLANSLLKTDNCDKVETILIEQFLEPLDRNLNTNSVGIFRCILEKYQQQCSALETQVQNQSVELKLANETLLNVRNHLSDKENEMKLVKSQKEKMNEINSAVTMDLIEREKSINEHIRNSYDKLIQLNIIGCGNNFNFSDTIINNIDLFVNHIVKEYNLRNISQDKEILEAELDNLKSSLEEREKQLIELQVQKVKLEDMNNNLSEELNDRDLKIHTLKTSHDELNKAYNMKIKENTTNLNTIDSLTEEIDRLKNVIAEKESTIEALSNKTVKTQELIDKINNLQEEKNLLQSLNEMIQKEKESSNTNLEKLCETIKQNNMDIDKMSSEILDLRESLNEATETIKTLKRDAEILSKGNMDMTQQLEEKTGECNRLRMNMKTHEKTAEIQSKIITRLQKSKEDDSKLISERQARITELSAKNTALLEECEKLKNDVTSSLEEIQRLKNAKTSLELRLSEMEESGRKSHATMDAILDSSRRRRRSIQESKRSFEEAEEHQSMEAVFGARSNKPGDLFMDIDDDSSGRSTPFTQRGRDSLHSKTDHSDKDEEHPSRPSSVMAMATRRRRQSSHDLHRSVIRHTPSPHDLSNKIISELEILQPERDSLNRGDVSEINKLKEQLTSCQQELEDLREQYRELDDECETCAQYLRERDEQCARLRREKTALEKTITELKSKLSSSTTQQMQAKRETIDASVNTDEDWTNLHSIVVDRMSFNAEVEKNKRLTKVIEELRFKKQELKNTMAKMQKALEKHSTKDTRELEATKEELYNCKEELNEWKMKYKALDDECETCSQYLKEREEQCRKLKEAKNALEAKVQELQEDAHAAAHAQAARKKRRSAHDEQRQPAPAHADVSTETTEDLFSCQEDTYRLAMDEAQARDIKRLKMMVESLNQQKVALELQLCSMPMMPNPMYIATGSAIVQNQQISDVMKENHKLKQKVAKLVNFCKKRGKSDVNRENEDPCEQA